MHRIFMVFLSLVLGLFVNLQGLAREAEISVTATRVETPLEQIGSSLTTLNSNDWKNRGPGRTSQVLQSEPGIDVQQAGPVGSPMSVFVRGASSEQTVFLLDGIELNDPMTPGRSFDLSKVFLEDLARIEICRGPQSTLYGSDAMGGVIELFTEKYYGKPQGILKFEGGSLRTLSETVGIHGGKKEDHYYNAKFSRLDSKGISAASKAYGNQELDGYHRMQFLNRFGLNITPKTRLDFLVRYLRDQADLDGFGGPGGDDPNFVSHLQQLQTRFGIDTQYFNGTWKPDFSFAYTQNKRQTQNDPDPQHLLERSRFSFNGRLFKVQQKNRIEVGQNQVWTLGLEYSQERGRADSYTESSFGTSGTDIPEKSQEQQSLYVQDQIFLDSVGPGTLYLTLGGRVDLNRPVTYRGTLSYWS